MTEQRYCITYRNIGWGMKLVKWGRTLHQTIQIVCRLTQQKIAEIEVYDVQADVEIFSSDNINMGWIK